MKKKIMVITNHSYMLWQFRRELIAKLQESYEVILVMPFVGHEEDFQNMGLKCMDVQLERRGSNPLKDFKLMNTYRDILKAERPDLVITYSIKPNIYAGLACGKLGIPFCANVQGLGTAFESKGMAQFVTMLYKKALSKASIVFFENQANAGEFCKRGIINNEKIKVLNGAGINLKHYELQEYPDNPVIHFLYLGRIMVEKGIEELFVAADRLEAEGENFVLDLVGFFEEEYKDRANDLIRRKYVEFHGFQSESRPYYGKADCVVLASYHEGMSNVLLEAASTGRPLITSNIPGCKEAVDEGETGYLVKAKDPDHLYQAMKSMVKLTREQRENMGRKGRAKMEREFAKEEVVAETIKALETFI